MPTASPPDAHLCLVHPLGDRAALGLLDTALALRDDLQALGVNVTLARQRLRPGAVNIVIGVEHGFDADAALGHCCLLLNTRPVRESGHRLPAAALRQLQRFALVDVDPASLRQLRQGDPATQAPAALWLPGPAAPGHAAPLPLSERPIGLLMAGVPNARQAALLGGMAQAGMAVARLDQPLAGPELAAMRSQARAVLCLLTEDDAAPDLLTMALALRQGTPVLAERPGNGHLPDAPPASAVMWFEPTGDGLAAALQGGVHGAAFAAAGQACLQAFAGSQAPAAAAQPLWSLAQACWARHLASPAAAAWQRPDRLCVQRPGQPRRPGWWHVAEQAGSAVDAVLDLRQPLAAAAVAELGACRLLDAGRWAPDQAGVPVAALQLLANGGRLVLQCAWPDLGLRPGADDAAARQAVQDALAPWSQRFWQAGLFQRRLQLDHIGWLDAQGWPVPAEQASSARIVLLAQDTSYLERSQARAMDADFGLATALQAQAA
jgi:hypothetical protein